MLQESMLIVPDKDNDNRDLGELRDSIASDLTTEFGGATMVQAQGGPMAASCTANR